MCVCMCGHICICMCMYVCMLPREQEQSCCHGMPYMVVHYKYYLHISKMVTYMDNRNAGELVPVTSTAPVVARVNEQDHCLWLHEGMYEELLVHESKCFMLHRVSMRWNCR